MTKPALLLIGAGGHAQACIDVIEQCGQFQIVGLVGTYEEIHATRLSYPILGTDEDLPQLLNRSRHACIAVGQLDTSERRITLYSRAIEAGFELPTIISPTAYVSRHATVGAGSIVMHGAVVNAGARIGLNCIINTHSLIEHGALVGDHCHISTGAILNGNVTVGNDSFVGSGSILKEGVSVGARCMIGMGVSVRHDQPDDAKFTGQAK